MSIGTGQRITGHVRWFNDKKGYGFIDSKSKVGADIFLHQRQFVRDADTGYVTFREGDEVEFELGRRPEGLYAIRVTMVETIHEKQL